MDITLKLEFTERESEALVISYNYELLCITNVSLISQYLYNTVFASAIIQEFLI